MTPTQCRHAAQAVGFLAAAYVVLGQRIPNFYHRAGAALYPVDPSLPLAEQEACLR